MGEEDQGARGRSRADPRAEPEAEEPERDELTGSRGQRRDLRAEPTSEPQQTAAPPPRTMPVQAPPAPKVRPPTVAAKERPAAAPAPTIPLADHELALADVKRELAEVRARASNQEEEIERLETRRRVADQRADAAEGRAFAAEKKAAATETARAAEVSEQDARLEELRRELERTRSALAEAERTGQELRSRAAAAAVTELSVPTSEKAAAAPPVGPVSRTRGNAPPIVIVPAPAPSAPRLAIPPKVIGWIAFAVAAFVLRHAIVSGGRQLWNLPQVMGTRDHVAAIAAYMQVDSAQHPLPEPDQLGDYLRKNGLAKNAGLEKDAWGTEYRLDTEPYAVRSAGPDREFDTDDDIVTRVHAATREPP